MAKRCTTGIGQLGKRGEGGEEALGLHYRVASGCSLRLGKIGGLGAVSKREGGARRESCSPQLHSVQGADCREVGGGSTTFLLYLAVIAFLVEKAKSRNSPQVETIGDFAIWAIRI